MTRTLFFRMMLGNFSEITNNKPIFSQYNIFYNYEYFFFQSAFWSLFNHHQRSQSNQKQCSLCCGSPCFRVLLCTHYWPLQWFLTCFRKEIRVLRPIFPDCFFLWLWFDVWTNLFYEKNFSQQLWLYIYKPMIVRQWCINGFRIKLSFYFLFSAYLALALYTWSFE